MLEQSVGSWDDTEDAHSIFGLLRLILSRLVTVNDKLDDLSASVVSVKRSVDNIRATNGGGGAYFTVHTSKPYLDGYKLKLTDGLSSKSCTIAYDEDSNYYAGVLRAPLSDSLTVTIIDSDSGAVQGSLAVTASTAGGYATIDLDALMNDAYASLLDVNGTLASAMYKDGQYTRDASKLPVIVDKLVAYDGHLADFIKSSTGRDITAASLRELYRNQSDFTTAVESSVGRWLIENPSVGKTIADSRELLRWISFNDTAVSLCEGDATFRGYLDQTTLPRLTSVRAGGTENKISGNLLCLSITSGCRGDQEQLSPQRYLGSCDTGNNNFDHYTYRVKSSTSSARGASAITRNGRVQTVISAASTSGYVIEQYYTYVTNLNESTTYPEYGNRDVTGANVTQAVYKFGDTVCVNGYGEQSVDCGTLRFEDGTIKNVGAQVAGSPAADSVITYINLSE